MEKAWKNQPENPGKDEKLYTKVGIQLENDMGENPGTDPHNENEWKREARKQKLAETEDELLSASAKKDCDDKAKRTNSVVD